MRLKAFTLVEMLLVLVLSAMVVTIAYAVYTHAHLMGQEFEKRTTDATELLTFDQHLRFDASKAVDVATTQGSFVLLAQAQVPLAQYSINAAGVRRTAGSQSDNFNIPLHAIHLDSTPHRKTLTLLLGPDPASSDTFYYTIARPATASTPLH